MDCRFPVFYINNKTVLYCNNKTKWTFRQNFDILYQSLSHRLLIYLRRYLVVDYNNRNCSDSEYSHAE